MDCEDVTLFCEYGPIQCPRFRVQNGYDSEGHPSYAFVENTGGEHPNQRTWEDHNELPAGLAYAPTTVYSKDGTPTSILDCTLTPEANKSEAGKLLDTAAMVGCLAAGVAAIVFTGPAAAFIIAGVYTAGGLWSSGRSVMYFTNRLARGQSIKNLESLGHVLGIAATFLPAGGAAWRTAATAVNLGNFGCQAIILAAKRGDMTQDQFDLGLLQLMLPAAGAGAWPGAAGDAGTRPRLRRENSARPANRPATALRPTNTRAGPTAEAENGNTCE
jgi:hypothetical protein